MENSSSFIEGLQDLISQVPDIIQYLLVGAIAMVPFLEGELASVLGVWAGFNPVVAFAIAAAGNFLSVFAVVTYGARVRESLIARRARSKSDRAAGSAGSVVVDEKPEPESKGRARFRRFVVRFGVPGASLLGPLALPTQFTSAILVGSGVSKRWVLLWQAVAIVVWTGLTTLIATGVLALIAG